MSDDEDQQFELGEEVEEEDVKLGGIPWYLQSPWTEIWISLGSAAALYGTSLVLNKFFGKNTKKSASSRK